MEVVTHNLYDSLGYKNHILVESFKIYNETYFNGKQVFVALGMFSASNYHKEKAVNIDELQGDIIVKLHINKK